MRELTVSIPTFNRSANIKLLLNSIKKKDCNHLHVAVSDNCSTDETIDVVNKSGISNLTLNINKDNFGVSYNVIRSIEIAKTKYVLLMSDEDSICHQGIECFLSMPDYDFGVALGTYLPENGVSSKIYDDEVLSEPNIAFTKHGYTHRYISGIIFNRDAIDFNLAYNQLDRPNQGFLGLYPHMFLMSELLLSKGAVTFSDPIVQKGKRTSAKTSIEKLSGISQKSPEHRLLEFETNLVHLCSKNLANEFFDALFLRLSRMLFHGVLEDQKKLRVDGLSNYYDVNSLFDDIESTLNTVFHESKSIVAKHLGKIDSSLNDVMRCSLNEAKRKYIFLLESSS